MEVVEATTLIPSAKKNSRVPGGPDFAKAYLMMSTVNILFRKTHLPSHIQFMEFTTHIKDVWLLCSWNNIAGGPVIEIVDPAPLFISLGLQLA